MKGFVVVLLILCVPSVAGASPCSMELFGKGPVAEVLGEGRAQRIKRVAAELRELDARAAEMFESVIEASRPDRLSRDLVDQIKKEKNLSSVYVFWELVALYPSQRSYLLKMISEIRTLPQYRGSRPTVDRWLFDRLSGFRTEHPRPLAVLRTLAASGEGRAYTILKQELERREARTYPKRAKRVEAIRPVIAAFEGFVNSPIFRNRVLPSIIHPRLKNADRKIQQDMIRMMGRYGALKEVDAILPFLKLSGQDFRFEKAVVAIYQISRRHPDVFRDSRDACFDLQTHARKVQRVRMFRGREQEPLGVGKILLRELGFGRSGSAEHR